MIAMPRHWKVARVGAFFVCAWPLGSCQGGSFSRKVLGGFFGANRQNNHYIERDVEAPDVFRTSEAGLWEGRPSLGGIWVTRPRTDIPERVMIRNESNKKSVIGALFRRDTASPGRRLVLSSKVAEALGMSAGVPPNLMVVALRKRMISENTPDQSRRTTRSASEETKVSSSIPTSTLSASTAPTAKLVRFDLEKPFIQIGIFGVEQNAKNTAGSMRHMGIVPITKTFKRKNCIFWRVLVGPTSTAEEQITLFQKVRTVGLKDAYAVTH